MDKGVKITLILTILVGAVVLFLLLINSSSQSQVTGGVVQQDSSKTATKQNCREQQVPYEEQEEYLKTEYYTENIAVEEQEALKYDGGLGKNWPCGSLTNYMECYEIIVQNLDTVAGVFSANCNFRTLTKTIPASSSAYINPGEVEGLICKVDIDFGEDVEITYNIAPPTKTVTKHKDVQREKQVTAYRPVIRYRTETICD
jgi:hypothetical protein